jgi:hypothetical protein
MRICGAIVKDDELAIFSPVLEVLQHLLKIRRVIERGNKDAEVIESILCIIYVIELSQPHSPDLNYSSLLAPDKM